MTSDSDEVLMGALAGGDDVALNPLMDRWQAPLRSFLYRYTQNEHDAYDLAQETFVRVYQHRTRFRPGARFSTWMFQIALNLASLTFMVPLGLASAGAVRVGYALGRHDVRGASHSGWMALTIGTAFMSSAAIVFVVAPRPLIGLFSSSEAVFAVGRRLLIIAAMFQLFDGLQGVSTGVLRGLGDTRTPMLVNLAGHWLIGLPVGYALCFWWRWGVVGLWAGLSVGLIVIGSTLLLAWHLRIAALRSEALR